MVQQHVANARDRLRELLDAKERALPAADQLDVVRDRIADIRKKCQTHQRLVDEHSEHAERYRHELNALLNRKAQLVLAAEMPDKDVVTIDNDTFAQRS